MPNREYIKSEIDTLPDSVIEKVQEFITFQKFSLGLFEHDKAVVRDMETASISSTDFWDNPDDEVWNHAIASMAENIIKNQLEWKNQRFPESSYIFPGRTGGPRKESK